MGSRNVLRELLMTGPGKAGVVFLLALVILSIYALVRFPLDFGEKRWSNPASWADNPRAAPPTWANWFSSRDGVRHTKLTTRAPVLVERSETATVHTYVMTLDFRYDVPPTFASISVAGVTFHGRPPSLTVSLARPDGTEAVLYREAVRGPREEETPPYRRFHQEPLRVALSTEPEVATAVTEFYRQQYGAEVSPGVLRTAMNRALFGVPDQGAAEGVRLLPGRYQVKLSAVFSDPRDSLESTGFVLGGTAFGLMGTDAIGRDLASGLLFGLPIALFIGIAASVISTVIGAGLGVISGYAGGRTDLVIQRLADLVSNVPLLPLLIFLVFIVGSNLYLTILFLVAFSWPGLTILLRSMVLQVRSGQLVESAITVGASRWRIMYRHIFPQMAPFVLAQMIFFAPGAILAEAGLSFLGLGDPSIPTWGQILESGFRTGAVYLGYWWWVIPPGVLIMITAVTFMFLSLGMEPVMNPRLRKSG